ncbi:MAG: type II toxin-antitoxin system RelE/ParE family toxin [Candidatus Adiutrix sp.]|jgi:phage-related protein|nr:type II toxin-antitoxin system RelE/ParE family toxin [Candidatus Adiutrix sp.]
MTREELSQKFPLRFFRSKNGREPVRDWLKSLRCPDSLIIGEDIRLVQMTWPIGMPVCRPLGNGLYEVRSSLPNGRIARVMFCFCDDNIILLHGFIKKTPKTPEADMSLARERKALFNN